MCKMLSYSLSGQGITPDKSTLFINLLKKSGVFFPPRPRFGSIGGKLYFHPVEPVEEKTEQSIMLSLEKHGVKNAKLEACGNYTKQ